MCCALAAFMQPGEGLNFVANFGVARQVGRLHPTLANAMRGFLLRAVILRLLAGVDQTGGFPSDLPPELALLHRWPPKAQAGGTRARVAKKGERVKMTRSPNVW